MVRWPIENDWLKCEYGIDKHPGEDVWYVVVDDARQTPERVRLPFEALEGYDVEFFAIKPRVVSIGDCDCRGFEFEIVVEPNEWEREIFDESLSELDRSYREFFSKIVESYSIRRPSWYKLKPGTRNYQTFSAGISGVRFGWVFHQGPEFSVELYISTSSKERNETIFEILQELAEDIESNLDVKLKWERLPGKQACRIKWPNPIEGRITELTTDQQSELVEWGVESMDKFQEEFETKLAELET